jgi:hypothetical protein
MVEATAVRPRSRAPIPQKVHLKQNGYLSQNGSGYLKKNINMTSVTNMNAPHCFKIHCSEKKQH